MRVIKIWVADERICRDKLNYVLTNINIHNFCQNHFNFITTTELSEADLVYGSVEKITSTNVALKMKASAHLLVKELIPLNFTVKNVRVNGKTLHFIKKTTEVESENPEKILPDLFETLFFHWSRYEEVIFPVEKRDQWDLMPEKELLVVKNQRIYKKPFIDELLQWFIKLFIRDFEIKKSFEVLKTYDIDYLHFDELNLIQNFKNLASILYASKSKLKGASSFVNSWLSKNVDYSFLENENLIKIIFLLLDGSHKFDFKKDKKAFSRIKEMVAIANSFGYEIALHPSYNTCYSEAQLEKEIKLYRSITDEDVKKSRQHFLHFDFFETVSILEKYNIKEDYSMGFNTYTGYKIGSSERFFYWNWKVNRSSKIVCTPFIWMDSAQKYENNKEYNSDLYPNFFETKIDNSKVHIILHPLLQNLFKYKN